MKIWILTSEYNDYNQYGSYFIKAYKDKPTINALQEEIGRTAEYCSFCYLMDVGLTKFHNAGTPYAAPIPRRNPARISIRKSLLSLEGILVV